MSDDLASIDVTRLYALLKDPDRTKAIGDSIIKALITDLLRARLGHGSEELPRPQWERGWERSGPSWERSWGRSFLQSLPPEVTKAVQNILAEVRLSDEEQKIVRDLNLRLRD